MKSGRRQKRDQRRGCQSARLTPAHSKLHHGLAHVSHARVHTFSRRTVLSAFLLLLRMPLAMAPHCSAEASAALGAAAADDGGAAAGNAG